MFFAREGEGIRLGLASIMSLGMSAKQIIEERNRNGEYKSLLDFLERMNGYRAITSRTITNLFLSGAFNSLGDYAELVHTLENNEIRCIRLEEAEKTGKLRIQASLEDKMIGCNLTYLDPIVAKAHTYTALHELQDKWPTFMAVKIVKNTKKKTSTGKDYILNNVVDLKSNKSFSLFNWDMKKFEDNEITIVKVYKNNNFISIAK